MGMSKIEEVKEDLLFFKDQKIPLTSKLIIKLSIKHDCSERWVWEAKKRLEEELEVASERFSILKELASDLKFYRSLFLEYVRKGKEPTAVDLRRMNEIDEYLKIADSKIQELTEGE